MIILHGGVENSTFWVWGESPGDLPPAKPGRSPAALATSPEPYPFDAGSIPLALALMEAVPGQTLPGGSEPPMVWLPTFRGRPVPSSPLIADVPQLGKVSLTPWKITALPLGLPFLIDLLCACINKETIAPGILVGKTLAYWSRILRFSGALVAREQFVPSLRPVGSSWKAVWQPVINGPDGQRLAHLLRGMPPVGRAFSRQSETTPPDRPPAEILGDLLVRFTDYLVRLPVVEKNKPTTRGGRVAVSRFDNIHDQWLFALDQTTDGTINADPADIAQLAEQVRTWQRPIAVSSETAFQLCFRMEEPPEEAPLETPWRLRYLLQARDDPSLYIPVRDAWKPEAGIASQFQSRSFQPREYLLTALGQAADLSPLVETSLQSKTPSEAKTDPSGAFQFLSETAYLLEQAGFNVLLPAWWTRKGSKNRIGVVADVKSGSMKSKAGLSLETIIEFNWKVALGEVELTLEELQELAQLKSPLVKIRGKWVQIHLEEIQAAIALLQKRMVEKTTLREVVQMALGGTQGPKGLPFAGVKATGWLAEFLNHLEGKSSFTELPTPEGFQGELRPYQVRGYSWLGFLRQWGLGACLADDMGLGKTIQTLALLQREWHEHPAPSLLICPTSVVANWKKEAERFTPELPVLIHHGGNRAKSAAFVKQAEKHALVLSSYSLLHRDRELFEKVTWSTVVLDEAQNIKNPATKQAQSARTLKAGSRIALTGTPVENHVGDLWSILEFLNPGWLGTQGDFRKRFYVPIQAQQDTEASNRLKRLTGPFILRRLKTDRSIIADLPEKLEMKVFCTLTREQASLYQAAVNDLNLELSSAEGIKRKGIILATLMKLKQICNHPAQFLKDNSAIPDRSGKLARLTEMLEEALQAEDRALVFTQFTEMGEILKKHLQETYGKEVLFLHGGVAREARSRMVERFQGDDGPRIFLLSLKAGGTGLNLTAANHVFHFDRWWNPAVENQATDRAFRIGQKRSVQVHKFVCVGTVEERIDEMIERKQQVAERVVGTKEDWLTELSNDQLKELFELRQDAIGE